MKTLVITIDKYNKDIVYDKFMKLLKKIIINTYKTSLILFII